MAKKFVMYADKNISDEELIAKIRNSPDREIIAIDDPNNWTMTPVIGAFDGYIGPAADEPVIVSKTL